jgi:hypothetical protein
MKSSLIKSAFVAALLILRFYGTAYADTVWSGSIFSGEIIGLSYSGTLPAGITASLAPGGVQVPFQCGGDFCPFSINPPTVTFTSFSWSASVRITDGQGKTFLTDIGPGLSPLYFCLPPHPL